MSKREGTSQSRQRRTGWRALRTDGGQKSLSEVNSTIPVPPAGSWLRRLLAFSGPGYMVSVGYMDPGNWATDLAGGSRFGYTLLCVIMISNLMAILLQALSARLGIVSGRDLAQACRDHFSPPVTFGLWQRTQYSTSVRPPPWTRKSLPNVPWQVEQLSSATTVRRVTKGEPSTEKSFTGFCATSRTLLP